MGNAHPPHIGLYENCEETMLEEKSFYPCIEKVDRIRFRDRFDIYLGLIIISETEPEVYVKPKCMVYYDNYDKRVHFELIGKNTWFANSLDINGSTSMLRLYNSRDTCSPEINYKTIYTYGLHISKGLWKEMIFESVFLDEKKIPYKPSYILSNLFTIHGENGKIIVEYPLENYTTGIRYSGIKNLKIEIEDNIYEYSKEDLKCISKLVGFDNIFPLCIDRTKLKNFKVFAEPEFEDKEKIELI